MYAINNVALAPTRTSSHASPYIRKGACNIGLEALAMKSSVAIFYNALSIMPAAMLVLSCVFPSAGFAQSAAAKPLDPVVGIIDAFKTHDVVALGEGDHGNEQGAEFRA